MTWLLDKVKLNGKEVDKVFIHRMLNIQGTYKLGKETLNMAQLCELLHFDRRTLQVSKAIKPYPIHAKFGQAFLTGVRWADEHPLD